jgi:hypothetical protein
MADPLLDLGQLDAAIAFSANGARRYLEGLGEGRTRRGA